MDHATSKSGEKCCATERHAVQARLICPDCMSRLCEGPHGGLSINMLCTSPACGSKFNEMGPFGVERISDAMPLRKVRASRASA